MECRSTERRQWIVDNYNVDMERLGIAAKREPAKIIDFTKYIDTNRSTNH